MLFYVYCEYDIDDWGNKIYINHDVTSDLGLVTGDIVHAFSAVSDEEFSAEYHNDNLQDYLMALTAN
jgi:hypothetical protein